MPEFHHLVAYNQIKTAGLCVFPISNESLQIQTAFIADVVLMICK
jgi:hypothetical protein